MKYLLIKLARWHMRIYCKIMSYIVGEKINDDDVYNAIIRSYRQR